MCRSRKARRCPPPEAAARPMRKVRIICDDPDATDSSSDEGAEKKIKRIVHQVLYPMINNKTTTKMTYSPSSRVKGVRKRKGGKWAAEIRNPILQKRVWLGTYPTKEEASRAYEMKRLEYEAQAHSVVVSTHVETRQNNNNNYYYNNNNKKKKKNESDDNGKVVVEKETSTSSEHGLKELEMVWSDEMMDLNIWSDEFGDSLDQFLPICDGLMGPLPDFDFDFNMDFYDEALDWIDDVSPPARP